MSALRKQSRIEPELISPLLAFDKTFIAHPHFVAVMNEAIDMISEPCAGLPSLCILSHSRGGKTTFAEKLKERFPDEPDAIIWTDPRFGRTTADRIPVVLAEVPDSPTTKTLAHAILKGLRDPHWEKGDRENATHRVTYLMERCGVRALLLDEAHLIVDASGTVRMEEIADWLKRLYNATHVAQILIGLPRTTLVFRYNEQLRGRFAAPLSLSAYSWGPASGVDNFAGLLSSFRKHIRIPVNVDFRDEFTARRFFYASSGVIGHLKRLLSYAIKDALRPGRAGVIDLEILAHAFERVIWGEFDDKAVNPFSKAYKGEAPPPLHSDSLTGIDRPTRRRIKAAAREIFTKR